MRQDTWTDIGFSGNKRYGAVTFTYNNKAYLVTGVNSGVMQTDFWVFNPASDTAKWTELRHISNTVAMHMMMRIQPSYDGMEQLFGTSQVNICLYQYR